MSGEYEYRPMVRAKAKGSEWCPIYTGRSGGRAYLTIAGARGVMSRARRENSLRAARAAEYLENPRFAANDERRPYWMELSKGFEYKIQRRPFGQWEDVP